MSTELPSPDAVPDSWPNAPKRAYHYSTAPQWTAERITQALARWAQETGSPPLSYEWNPGPARTAGLIGPAPTKFELERDRWPGNTTVYRVFESWAEALQTAGLRSSHRPCPKGTLTERVDRARSLADQGLSTTEIADHLGVLERTAAQYLSASPCATCPAPVVGKGDRCKRCAVIETNPRNWTEQQLIDAAHAWRRETGRFPTMRNWVPTDPKWAADAPRWPTTGAVMVTLGGFNELRLALDRQPYNAPWDRATAIEAIHVFVAAEGRVPTKQEWESGAGDRYPSSATLQRLFGGMRAALSEAGYQSAGEKLRWDRDRIIAAVRVFAAEHGRPPKHVEWIKASPDHPSSSTVVRVFGNFRIAIETSLGADVY